MNDGAILTYLKRKGIVSPNKPTTYNPSLREIKEKHPNRTDLIESMSETLEHLHECKVYWTQIEKEYRALRQSAYRLELINLDLKSENNRLTAENNALNYE